MRIGLGAPVETEDLEEFAQLAESAGVSAAVNAGCAVAVAVNGPLGTVVELAAPTCNGSEYLMASSR